MLSGPSLESTPAITPAMSDMSDAELTQAQIDELKALLQGLKQSLSSHLAQTRTDTRPVTLDQQSVGRVSRIDAIQQQQMAVASHDQASQQLKQVIQALHRIETDEYGFCLTCAEPVLFARLQAQPIAGLCLKCQSASEIN